MGQCKLIKKLFSLFMALLKAQKRSFGWNKSLILFHQSKYLQTRAQSTLNPPIDNNISSSPVTKEPHSTKNIITSIKTELNNKLIPSYLEETYWWAYIHPNA